MSVPDPYKVLQVDPEAEDEVIEAAYRRLARKYHPDVSPGPESQDRMVRINQAWELLRDPIRRAAVDRARERSSGTAARVAAADSRAAAAEAHARATTGHPATPPPGMTTQAPTAGATSAGIWSSGLRAAQAPAFPGTSDPASGGFGPPPGNPSGSVLNFGRYTGWSLGEIARVDLEYLEWLSRMPIGLTYRSELDELLRVHGRRGAGQTQASQSGLYRRR